MKKKKRNISQVHPEQLGLNAQEEKTWSDYWLLEVNVRDELYN